MNNTQSGKTYVITGATSGIGRAISEQLVDQGAAIIGIGRSPERCRTTESELRTRSELRARAAGSAVVYIPADLSLQSEVRKAAIRIGETLTSRGKTCLDGLVNNAGTFTYWMALTPEGFETQWAVNHLAPFLLTLELLPLLQAAPSARVVTVSSASHYSGRLDWGDIQLRRHYNGLRAYNQSKLANVLFTSEFNRRIRASSTVRAFAADPGLVKTDIGLKSTPAIVRWIWSVRRSGGISSEESARGIVYLLTEPSIQDSEHIYWKHGQPKTPSRISQDGETARRLWSLSETMCGIQEGI